MQLLEVDPARRLTAREALTHPWFCDVFPATPSTNTDQGILMSTLLDRRQISSPVQNTLEQVRSALRYCVVPAPHRRVKRARNHDTRLNTSACGEC